MWYDDVPCKIYVKLLDILDILELWDLNIVAAIVAQSKSRNLDAKDIPEFWERPQEARRKCRDFLSLLHA